MRAASNGKRGAIGGEAAEATTGHSGADTATVATAGQGGADTATVATAEQGRGAAAGFGSAPEVPLPGVHQRANAALALAAARVIDPAAELRPTRWPGRFDRVEHVVLDVAHNPAAVAALVEMAEPMTVLFACAPDKDIETMTELLSRLGPIWTVEGDGLVGALGAERTFAGLDAIGEALHDGRPLLVCGSHRLVGAAYDVLAGAQPHLDPTDPRS